ncbi:ribosomal lysine N-methyltransferase [Aspergillus undulatus]|uniref:ribosomal lysine N-methyltransferase n=1 Tax=Aspergillus undulatus TaxID=1810928 RepID=UPI003CCD2507
MFSSTHSPNPDDFERQSNEFATWLLSRPGVTVNSKIRIADLRGNAAGRGVGKFFSTRTSFPSSKPLVIAVTQSDVVEGEELFTIPRDLVLSTHNSKLKGLLQQDLEELGPWLSLMLVMIYEYLQGDASTWAPYFRILPQSFDTLMFWSPGELAELQGSAVVEKIGRRGAEKSILDSIVPVVQSHPSLFPPVGGLSSYDGDAGALALLHLAHIMGSLIMAYAFDVEKPENEDERDGEDGYLTDEEEEQSSKGMVPLADMLNADADRNNARLFQEEESLIMKAIKPIRAGEEILNDYGEIPRADLLRRYGYVTENYAPYDVIELSLEALCSSAGLSDSNIENQPWLQFLEELELLDDGYAIPRPSLDDALTNILPEELALLLKTFTLTPEQLATQQQKQKPPNPSFGQDEAKILFDAILLSQQRYNTTVEQDREFLAQLSHLEASAPLDGSARRRKMAIQVRLGEKEIFEIVKAMINNHLANAENTSTSKRSANDDGDDSRRSKAQRT